MLAAVEESPGTIAEFGYSKNSCYLVTLLAMLPYL